MTNLVLTKESFRILRDLEEDIPFGARSCGRYRVLQPWRGREHLPREVIQLFWVVDGQGSAVINGETRLLEPGDVFFYYPGDKHIFRAEHDFVEFEWMTVDGSMAMGIIDAFKFPREPLRAGKCPEELFNQLESEIKDISPYGQRKAAATAYRIISLARGIPDTQAGSDSLISRCLDIIDSSYMDSDLNVNSIAEELSVHRSRLSRLFREKMDVSLIDYLISTRINKALSLLRSSSLTIADVSTQTGYKDPDYFAKSFKKSIGQTPGEYRQSLG